MSQFTVESARELLFKAGVFYYNSVEEERKKYEQWAKEDKDGFWTEKQIAEMLEEVTDCQQTLNQNDTWCWASAIGEKVEDSELIEVAELFWRYGEGGILYWVSKKNDGMRSEFYDNNRKIEFVENEERIRKEKPGSSDRAYYKAEYTIKGDRK